MEEQNYGMVRFEVANGMKLLTKAIVLFEIGFVITIITYYILFIAWFNSSRVYKTENIRWLTIVKDMLRKTKRRSFYPLISSLGVKMAINTVNILKQPLYFQSRCETSLIVVGVGISFVNNKKQPRRGLGSQC